VGWRGCGLTGGIGSCSAERIVHGLKGDEQRPEIEDDGKLKQRLSLSGAEESREFVDAAGAYFLLFAPGAAIGAVPSVIGSMMDPVADKGSGKEGGSTFALRFLCFEPSAQ
jgi:hypothetical protein